jgi:hypothetical protein
MWFNLNFYLVSLGTFWFVVVLYLHKSGVFNSQLSQRYKLMMINQSLNGRSVRHSVIYIGVLVFHVLLEYVTKRLVMVIIKQV